MSDSYENHWMGIGALTGEIRLRSTLNPREVDEFLKAAVTGENLEIRYGSSDEDLLWSNVRNRFGWSDPKVVRAMRDSGQERYNPLTRGRGDESAISPPRQPSLSDMWDSFKRDGEVRLNLGKFMLFLHSNDGTIFTPLPDEEIIDLETKGARPGRKPDEIWQAVEDDLLLWIDRNELPDTKARLNEWVEKWLIDRGFEKNHKAKKLPGDATIKEHVSDVVDRYKKSIERQKTKPT